MKIEFNETTYIVFTKPKPQHSQKQNEILDTTLDFSFISISTLMKVKIKLYFKIFIIAKISI